MSSTTITFDFKADGVSTNPTSVVFRDAGGTYGVKRQDTDASVVAIDTALTSSGTTGSYHYTFTDPAANLTYDYGIQVVYNGETYNYASTKAGGQSTATNLLDVLPRVKPYVGSASDQIVEQQLRIALRDWAKDTLGIRETVSITGVADQTEYTVTSTYSAQILKVYEVRVDESAVYWNMENPPNLIKLTGAPTGGEAIEVDVALLPDEDATGVPEEVTNEWGDGIASGCLYRMFMMAGMPWANEQAAMFHRDEFWDSMALAKRSMASNREDDRTIKLDYAL